MLIIPPASPAAIFELLILSNNEVLPWSTCPMIVTTGGLVTKLIHLYLHHDNHQHNLHLLKHL